MHVQQDVKWANLLGILVLCPVWLCLWAVVSNISMNTYDDAHVWLNSNHFSAQSFNWAWTRRIGWIIACLTGLRTCFGHLLTLIFGRYAGRCDESQRGKVKEVKIPVTSNAGFEEVLEDCDASGGRSEQPVNIEQLAQLLDGSRTGSGAEIRVRLSQSSPDVPTYRHHRHNDDMDLPRDNDISLTTVFIEPCVLASVTLADAPAFHLPLRTDMDVRLVRRDSPASPSSHIRLSTKDRCVEALYDDDLAVFMMNCRRDLSTDCHRSVLTSIIYQLNNNLYRIIHNLYSPITR